MSYKYWIDKPETSTKNFPVIITLHGIGSNYNDLPGVILPLKGQSVQIHIQGDLPHGPGFAYYEMDFSKKPEEVVIMDAVNRLHRFILEVVSKESLEGHSRTLLGFSQGAILTEALLANFPDDFDRGVILNARLLGFLKTYTSTAVQKIFIAQGAQDPLFPIPSGEKIQQYFEANGQAVTYKVYNVGHGINHEAITDIMNWFTI